MAFISLVPPIVYNVKQYNAAVDGATDDAGAINSVIGTAGAAGGGIVYIPGTAAVNSPVTLNQPNVILAGPGVGGGLRPLASFSGAEIVNVTASNCGVREMSIAYANTTYSSNPTANGIEITAAGGVALSGLLMQYINGWAIESASTSGAANYNTWLEKIHAYSGKQGIHILGHAPSGNFGFAWLRDCNCDAMQGGDCYLLEDAHDILMSDILGNCSAGSGSSLHIKGTSAAIHLTNPDFGPYPGPTTGPVVKLDAGTNGSPFQVSMVGGILLSGNTGIEIDSGTRLVFQGVQIYNNGTYGVNVTGGDDILFDACQFSQNGTAGSSGRYDAQSSTTGHVRLRGCDFLTPQGSTSGHTNNAINATAGTVLVEGCNFYGAGYNSGNIFNNGPYSVRHSFGYNPFGALSPTVPASGTNFALLAYDATYYVTGGTVSSIKVGGTDMGATSGAFRVPAQVALNITYSAAPTVKAFGD